MTRINVGIKPRELSNPHLIAEHREIVRIPRAIKRGSFRMENQPEKFKLGEGHVKFFYDKLGYLKDRYIALYQECVRRGLNVHKSVDAFEDIEPKYMGQYTETPEDREILLERIAEKVAKNPKLKLLEPENT